MPNAGKRRKGIEEDDQDPGGSFEQMLGEFDLTPGCGRTMCRNCCFENVQRLVLPIQKMQEPFAQKTIPPSNTITCYDCYGGC
jgi:hypothetical protein